MRMKKRGFTLIELLVAVLIIAVLAAVAVPQYHKAVRKAKLAEVGAMFSSLSKAIDVWLLENGGYPKSHVNFFDLNSNAHLNLDIQCDSRTRPGSTIQCNTSKGAWEVGCKIISSSHDTCTIEYLFGYDSVGNQQKNTYLASSFKNQSDRIEWTKGGYGLWNLEAVVTADTQLRKQVCQWWRENYGVHLMTGTAASDHCKE